MLFDQIGQPHQDVDVGFDDFNDPGPADFEDDFFTTFQFAAMHLGDTGCGERFPGEFTEHLTGRITEFALYLSINLFNCDCRNLVLQLTEFLDVLLV